tara:strand:- start:817 stop:987 length:171 start_codon:yes stop_codon:yes gene_type:complete
MGMILLTSFASMGKALMRAAESASYARAAAELARQGQYEAAKRLYEEQARVIQERS